MIRKFLLGLTGLSVGLCLHTSSPERVQAACFVDCHECDELKQFGGAFIRYDVPMGRNSLGLSPLFGALTRVDMLTPSNGYAQCDEGDLKCAFNGASSFAEAANTDNCEILGNAFLYQCLIDD